MKNIGWVLGAIMLLPVLAVAEDVSWVQLAEEEKLAHDLYTALGETHNDPRFSHIAQAEQRHWNAVRGRLESLRIAYVPRGSGEFIEPAVQQTYDELLRRGRRSLGDALQVGAEVEAMDIATLRQLAGVSSSQDEPSSTGGLSLAPLTSRASSLRFTPGRSGRDADEGTMSQHSSSRSVLSSSRELLRRLECGSSNHLRAFLRERGAVALDPYLSGAQVGEILGRPHERCGRGGMR